MGIQGLLPLLKSTMEPIHIEQLEGCSVAVDTYSWLHKGALSCSRDLCKGSPTSRHIEYCMHRVNLLRHFGVKPILVFDGGFLPMKMEQENKRARSRKENLARAMEHEANGNSAGAYECYQKAVDITPLIARDLIEVLRQENVSYVVAPYEADAQMTYMALQNHVHAVITEDSDLIPFGCPRIIFKMDKFGQGQEFQSSRLHSNREISFAGFSRVMILEMCILSGCDYLQSLPGMGLKRAHSLIAKFKSHDKVIRHLKYSGVAIPPLYEELFKKAVMTFQHQRVYDVFSENLVHLHDIPNNFCEDLEFLGPFMAQDIAIGIAKGDLDPLTRMPFQLPKEEFALQSYKYENGDKILDDQYLKRADNGRKKLDLPVQKNLLTKYFCFASLEAKRNFKAPRKSPVSLDDTPTCNIEEHSHEEMICQTKGSSDFLEESGNDFDIANGFGASDSSTSPNFENMKYNKVIKNDKILVELQKVRKTYKAVLKECDMKPSINELKDEVVCCDSKRIDTCVTQNIEREMSNKKVVVSRFFQHTSINVGHDTPHVDRVDKIEDNLHESRSSLDNFSNKVSLKRKNDIVGSVKKNQKPRTTLTDSSAHRGGRDDGVLIARNDGGKFGSNISHLCHYNGIAEKSMERFVSLISSFRHTPGSRASGLRAPLKDIQNGSSKLITPDFTRFAYNPKADQS